MQAQGMQGWRRFTFFDRDDAAAAVQPDTLAAAGLKNASCAAAAGSWLAFGRPDGSVALLDTTSQVVTGFRAHPTAVQHMVVLPVSFKMRCLVVLPSMLPSRGVSSWHPAVRGCLRTVLSASPNLLHPDAS